jgi:hypothetical protein
MDNSSSLIQQDCSTQDAAGVPPLFLSHATLMAKSVFLILSLENTKRKWVSEVAMRAGQCNGKI